ncbi:hypothetical protein MHBO_000258 [Bonamia ostreae]|uniref:Uncharacterized protein n=1 Tax=Bonamia ostreae TaxID=126728 RepID=A0ABV2AF13_9EUKA
MSYGMPWSIRDPSLIEQFFQKYKKFVQRNDSTLNYERLSIVEKGIKSCVDLRFESDKLKEEMVHIAETINLNFSSILSVSEKFSGYQVIQKLGYCRSQVSALLLYVKGLGNRIRVEEQACFKVKAVFEFEKSFRNKCKMWIRDCLLRNLRSCRKFLSFLR